jgi:phosphopantothenoylcysteine decarboxylase/phosphopantothenate--cysteine ligase
MNILLGVCGSISAYKAIDIARGLIKQGYKIKVILTQGALKFVVPEVFKYLGVEEVYLPEDDFHYKKTGVLHVDLSRWADKLAIAPLSANTLANLASGGAHDLLGSLFLALDQKTPIVLYPAMNSKMLNNPLVTANLDRLEQLFPQLTIIPPAFGELACQELGPGKLPPVNDIVETLPYLGASKKTGKKKILITTGATCAPLDPVRFMTNPSSGLTGYYLALEAISRGHQVTLIKGLSSPKLDALKNIPGITFKSALTPTDMKNLVERDFPQCDLYISAAAISDIEFIQKNDKIKKSTFKNHLEITRAPDILGSVIKLKSKQKIVGFAAELSLDHDILKEKWQRKPVDLLVGTQVHNGLVDNQKPKGFIENQAIYKFFRSQGVTFEGSLTKKQLSKNILDEVWK